MLIIYLQIWGEVFEEFKSPLQASVPGNSNKSTKVSLKLNETAYSNNENVHYKKEITSSVPRVSEGEPLPTVSEGAHISTVSEEDHNAEGEGYVAKKRLDREGYQQLLSISLRQIS